VNNLSALLNPTTHNHPCCPPWCAKDWDSDGDVAEGLHTDVYRHHMSEYLYVPLADPDHKIGTDIRMALTRFDMDDQVGEIGVCASTNERDDDRWAEMLSNNLDLASAARLRDALQQAIDLASSAPARVSDSDDTSADSATVIAGLPGALTASFVMDALCSLQIPHLGDPAQIGLLADVARVGPNPGYEVEFELPRGVDAMAVCDRRSQLSAALRREPGTVYPSGGKHGQRHLVLYVADEPWLVDTLPDSATTTVAAFTDTLFDAKLGEVPTEVKVELWHEWNNWAETAVHVYTSDCQMSADGAERLGQALLTAAGEARAQRRTAPAEVNADKIDGGSGMETCTRCEQLYRLDSSPSLIHCWQCDEAWQEEGR
jgi:hypothetical protein